MLLDASVYDKLFIGFEVISVAVASWTFTSVQIAQTSSSRTIPCTSIVVESVLKRAVKSVTLHPK
jgi:hypothetical protein